jgi:hypothetical protein
VRKRSAGRPIIALGFYSTFQRHVYEHMRPKSAVYEFVTALGQEQTYPDYRGMSALPSEADIQAVSRNVRFVP